jgi:hypothetical protein
VEAGAGVFVVEGGVGGHAMAEKRGERKEERKAVLGAA